MTWSFEILPQSGRELWPVVCGLACLVLVCYAVFARLWESLIGILAMGLIALAVVATICIAAVPAWHTPAVGLVWMFVLLCLLSATFYLNLRSQLGAVKCLSLLGLRMLALAMLVPMFFEPRLRFVSWPKPERPLVFLIDTSGSMSFQDVPNGPTRLGSVWQMLRGQAPRVTERFIPQYYAFSTKAEKLASVEDLAKRTADGQATDIAKCIGDSLALAKAGTEAELVLISDGRDNVSARKVAGAVAAFKHKIYTVRVGSELAEPTAFPNVAVDDVESKDEFTVNRENKLTVTVKSTALANRIVEVKLAEIDAEGKTGDVLARPTLVLQPLAQGQRIEIPYTPRTPGIKRLAVWIEPTGNERSLLDNRQEFQNLAVDPRIKVLYFEGQARPEYKALRGALGHDQNIELANALRITPDRVSFEGTVGGDPFTRLPTALADWKRFDIVIIGDVDSSYLTGAQQRGLEQFVSGGGGLLMIGGQHSFGPGGYAGTPVEQCLPVFVGDLKSPQETAAFVPRITAAGQSHPILDGLGEWFSATPDEAHKLPPLRGNVVLARPKAGASVLLVHQERTGPDGQPQIVLAVELYGSGRSAALSVDTTSQWNLPLRGMGQESPFNKFWGQLVRWLATQDVRNRASGAGLNALLNKSVYQLGDAVKVRAMTRDERGDATSFADVKLILRGKGAKDQQLPLSPVRTGLYDVSIPPQQAGDWEAEVIAAKDGKELGRQTLKFTVLPPAGEMHDIAADPKLLKEIATASNGYYYELAQLPDLIDHLIATEAPDKKPTVSTLSLANAPRALIAWLGRDPRWDPKYDLPMQAALVVALLATEWVLRRRWQLP